MTKTAVNSGVRPVDGRGAYPVVKTTVAAYPQLVGMLVGKFLETAAEGALIKLTGTNQGYVKLYRPASKIWTMEPNQRNEKRKL